MDKKKLSDGNVQYRIPPRLVNAAQGWYFLFYAKTPSGEMVRFRKSFQVNRIKSKSERRAFARALLDRLEELLELGYPYVGEKEVFDMDKFIALFQKKNTTATLKTEKKFSDVLQLVTALHSASESKDTARTYNSRCKLLLDWLESEKMSDLPVTGFTVQVAQDYMDSVRIRVGANTYNNYRGGLTVLFNSIVEKGFLAENPFHSISAVKKSKKKRRPFTEQEAVVFLEEIYENDWWLLVMVALHVGECVRRTEAYRMRFGDVNLKSGYLTLDEFQCLKSKKEQVRTIPEQLLWVFRDERFSGFPKNWLIFGQNAEPHPSISAGEGTWKRRHREVLIRLKIEGKLKNIEGLSLYSWKDTGLTTLSKSLNMFQLRDHAGHASTEMTMRYYHAEKIIPEVAAAELPFFRGIAEKQKERVLAAGGKKRRAG